MLWFKLARVEQNFRFQESCALISKFSPMFYANNKNTILTLALKLYIKKTIRSSLSVKMIKKKNIKKGHYA